MASSDCVTRLETDRLFAAQMRGAGAHLPSARDCGQIGCQECMEILDPSYSPFLLPPSIGHPPSLLLCIYLHTFAANITLNSVLSREGHYYETMTREPKICISIYNLKEATPNVKSTVTDVAE